MSARDAAYQSQQDTEREWIEEGGEEAMAQVDMGFLSEEEEVCKWCGELGCVYAACEVLERMDAELTAARKVVAEAVVSRMADNGGQERYCYICHGRSFDGKPDKHNPGCPVAEYNEVVK